MAAKHKTPTYMTWRDMMRRCYNPTREKYKSHGARGIQVCDRWHTYDNFLADMGFKPDGLTLDRIDNDGHYTPTNCKWSTPKQQANNRRDTPKFLLRGFYGSRAEHADNAGTPLKTVRGRISLGWNLEEAIYGR